MNDPKGTEAGAVPESVAKGRDVNPFLRTALEYGPILAFFVAYLALRDRSFDIGGTSYDGFIIVTAGFIPLLIATTAAMWWLTGHLSRMQIVTLVLVIVFGGLSVWLNDDRFFKMKPTLIYLIFGGLLAIGLMRGQSWLRYVLDGMIPLDDEGWMKLTRRLMVFFLGLAVLNEVIWRTMSTDAWVTFKTFGLTAAIFLFFLTQSSLFRDHDAQADAESDSSGDS